MPQSYIHIEIEETSIESPGANVFLPGGRLIKNEYQDAIVKAQIDVDLNMTVRSVA
jgi:hypothetical protein